MKIARALSLIALVVMYGVPVQVSADIPEPFALPDGHAAEAYSADLQSVLREKYRLKIETGTRSSILQWSFVDGDMPQGLTVRTDGTIAGTPKAPRAQPYRFRVRVFDAAGNNPEPLVLDFSISIAASRLRLTKINAPALTPLDEAGPPDGAPVAGPAVAPDERVPAAPARGADRNPPLAADTGAANKALPVSDAGAQPATGMSDRTPTPATTARRDSAGTGIFSKLTGVLGRGQGNRHGSARHGGSGGHNGCPSNSHTVESDEAHTPLQKDTSTQNTCVEFTNLNTLKYRVEFNEERTTTAGPDISSLPFLPKITPTTASAVTPAASSTPSPASPVVAALMARTAGNDKAAAANRLGGELHLLDERFNNVRNNLSQAEETLRTTVEDPINDAVAKVQDAHKASLRLANGADVYLQSGSMNTLLGEVAAVKNAIDGAMAKTWPAAEIGNVLRILNDLTTQLEDLRFDNQGNQDVSQEAWAEWIGNNQDRYNHVRDRIAELKTKVNTIGAGAGAFSDSKNVLAEWQLIITNVNNQGEAAFRQEAFVSCHNDEGENQSSKLTISKTDRTSSNQAAATREVLTVNCYSRVALTAGFNFSTLDEKEFSVVQSAGSQPGTVVKKFGFTSRSSFRPNPLMLLNPSCQL
jgi:hypothetical protein